jgi:hypothetical protein
VAPRRVAAEMEARTVPVIADRLVDMENAFAAELMPCL